LRFFYDCEFLDDGERIAPISIGMVADNSNVFYRVYSDWLKDRDALAAVRRHRFLMAEVVPHLPGFVQDIVMGRRLPMTDDEITPIVMPCWMVAHELEEFVSDRGRQRRDNELWAYYSAYDHVMLAQTFGPMIQLPECVPMFTNDLVQLESMVNRQRVTNGLSPVERPAQGTEHHALDDARWNRAFHRALVGADLGACPETTALAWTIDKERDLVTVPSRVFVAGYERLESVGPNEGLDPEDEEPARRLWRALL
jgi:hypothetical protein